MVGFLCRISKGPLKILRGPNLVPSDMELMLPQYRTCGCHQARISGPLSFLKFNVRQGRIHQFSMLTSLRLEDLHLDQRVSLICADRNHYVRYKIKRACVKGWQGKQLYLLICPIAMKTEKMH